MIIASTSYINREWPSLSKILCEDPTNTALLNDLLSALLSGKLVLWLAMKQQEIRAYMVTGPQGGRLRIFVLNVIKELSFADWEEGLRVLRKYAKNNGLRSVCGETNNAKLALLAEKLGGRMIVEIGV